MSNFNQYFKKTGAKIMVDRFFNGIDLYNPKNKLNIQKWYIVDEPEQPASYFIENGLTATHKVRIEYTVGDKPEILTTEFEVPKEIEGAFIIDGDYRIATNTLGSDFDCRVQMSGSNPWKINFDYGRQFDINKRVLRIRKFNTDIGLPDKIREIKYEDIDGIVVPELKEELRLTPRQRKKFQIKLDLDYDPEFITTKLIDDCLAYGDDRLKDLIIDKQIESVPQGFMNFLFKSGKGKSFFAVRRKIASYFSKYNKLPDPVNTITTLCQKHWKGSSESAKGGSEIQVAPGINAINLHSLGSKIMIPETVAYNKTFADLIDVADTPINQSSNKINSLTVSTHLTDENILFDVLTKDFQKVTMDYLDYLNSKVVSSEYVDYEKKELIPNKDGLVEVKHRMRRKMIPVDQIDLVDLPTEYRLSATTRRIPFMDHTDSVRIEMGSSMLKQAIPLPNAERPLIDTGNTEELEDNIMNDKFRYDEGKVTKITDDEVIIELPSHEEVSVPRRTALQGNNDVDIFTEPKVKVGQKVKKGDIITGAVGLQKDTYMSGINALVLFHAMYGWVNEDAVVVSESFANKMCHYSFIDLTIDTKNSEAIKWIAPIGTRVKYHDPIVTLYKGVRLDEINKKMKDQLGGILGDLNEYTIESSVEVPNNIDEAYVGDVLIQENVKPKIPKSVKKPDYTFAHSSDSVIKDYEKTKDRKVIYDKFPEYIASDTLDPVDLSDKSYKVVYTIRIRLIKRTTLMNGSKLTNRYGGKGVVSKILPDDQMPIMVDQQGNKRVVEVVMNPYSNINRKIPSVIMETSMGLICHRIRNLVEDYKKTKAGQAKIKPLLEKYYPGRFTDMSVEDIIKKHDNSKVEEMYYFNVGCFSKKYTPELITEWMEELEIEPVSQILIPQDQVADLDEMKREMSPEAYEKVVKKMKGKYVPVDKPLMVGYVTMIELFKIPYYDEKVTTSMYMPDGDINPFKASPILGRGAYRPTGQAIGEMELSCYLANNAKDFIEYSRGDTSTQDSMEFMNNLIGLGLTIKNEQGYNMGASSLRNSLNDMKTKFRLKKK